MYVDLEKQNNIESYQSGVFSQVVCTMRNPAKWRIVSTVLIVDAEIKIYFKVEEKNYFQHLLSLPVQCLLLGTSSLHYPYHRTWSTIHKFNGKEENIFSVCGVEQQLSRPLTLPTAYQTMFTVGSSSEMYIFIRA